MLASQVLTEHRQRVAQARQCRGSQHRRTGIEVTQHHPGDLGSRHVEPVGEADRGPLPSWRRVDHASFEKQLPQPEQPSPVGPTGRHRHNHAGLQFGLEPVQVLAGEAPHRPARPGQQQRQALMQHIQRPAAAPTQPSRDLPSRPVVVGVEPFRGVAEVTQILDQQQIRSITSCPLRIA
jgi:hypothetical protein